MSANVHNFTDRQSWWATREKHLLRGSSRLTALSFPFRVRYPDGQRLCSQRREDDQNKPGLLHLQAELSPDGKVEEANVGRCAEGPGIRGARRRAGAKWWGDRSWGLVHKGRFLAEQDSKTRVLPQADTAGSTVSERLEGCTQRLFTAQWQIP